MGKMNVDQYNNGAASGFKGGAKCSDPSVRGQKHSEDGFGGTTYKGGHPYQGSKGAAPTAPPTSDMHAYLGHFRHPDVLKHGHNTNLIPGKLADKGTPQISAAPSRLRTTPDAGTPQITSKTIPGKMADAGSTQIQAKSPAPQRPINLGSSRPRQTLESGGFKSPKKDYGKVGSLGGKATVESGGYKTPQKPKPQVLPTKSGSGSKSFAQKEAGAMKKTAKGAASIFKDAHDPRKMIGAAKKVGSATVSAAKKVGKGIIAASNPTKNPIDAIRSLFGGNGEGHRRRMEAVRKAEQKRKDVRAVVKSGTKVDAAKNPVLAAKVSRREAISGARHSGGNVKAARQTGSKAVRAAHKVSAKFTAKESRASHKSYRQTVKAAKATNKAGRKPGLYL